MQKQQWQGCVFIKVYEEVKKVDGNEFGVSDQSFAANSNNY